MTQTRKRGSDTGTQPSASRRGFLAAAIAMPAVAAAPLAAAGGSRHAAAAPASAERGYHMTDHTATYYRLAARL